MPVYFSLVKLRQELVNKDTLKGSTPFCKILNDMEVFTPTHIDGGPLFTITGTDLPTYSDICCSDPVHSTIFFCPNLDYFARNMAVNVFSRASLAWEIIKDDFM